MSAEIIPTENHPTAVGIFLDGVHRSMEYAGKRPVANVVSTALVEKIKEEANLPTLIPCADPLCVGPLGQNYICGYPVRVVESPHLFALSLASEDGPDL